MPIGWYEFGFIGLVLVSYVIWRYLPRTALPAVLLVLADYFGWISLSGWQTKFLELNMNGHFPLFSNDGVMSFTAIAVLLAFLGTLFGLWLDFFERKSNSPNHDKKELSQKKL
ncbi:MAG: hypothetical protein HYT12_03995 [Candidatus Liptonbacteria bacterium]|nr:hypothetical protein [Candidatus Liptonbacteria bacterium]